MHPHAHPHRDHAHNHAAPTQGSHIHAGGMYVALIVTLVFALVEAVGGWWTGSLALLGDAGHMLSDAMALGVASFALWLSRRPPSARHSYGLARAEIVAALVNGLLMLVVVIGIVVEAIKRLQSPQTVSGGAVIAIALLGLLANVTVLWMLSRGEKNLNSRAAALHVLGDLLGSVAAVIAGAVIYFTGWSAIDPLLSLLICALIVYSTFQLLREAVHVLMEGVPRHLDLAAVGRAMAEIPSTTSVHDLHIWSLASGRLALSAHVVVRDMNQWTVLLAAQRKLLRERFDIEHVTLQPEIEIALKPADYASVIPIVPHNRQS